MPNDTNDINRERKLLLLLDDIRKLDYTVFPNGSGFIIMDTNPEMTKVVKQITKLGWLVFSEARGYILSVFAYTEPDATGVRKLTQVYLGEIDKDPVKPFTDCLAEVKKLNKKRKGKKSA